MLTIKQPDEMRRRADAWRKAGETIAFVPTMGALHEGHLSLMREGRRRTNKLVASIFVNPTQFGANEDFSKYPRDTEGDLAKCATCDADAVFLPDADTMYPEGDQTFIEVSELAKPLCGRFRPGHFRGVATVVYKLFRMANPHCAIFGEKDYQQLKIIERMTLDLALPIKIIGAPIVREPDGLAMSSRNQYLSPDERRQAAAIYRALQRIQWMAKNETSKKSLIAAGREILNEAGITKIDYLEIVDDQTLESLGTVDGSARCCIAAYVGSTRLIDNIALKNTGPICSTTGKFGYA